MEDIPQIQWNQDNSDYMGFKWEKWFVRVFTKLVGNAGRPASRSRGLSAQRVTELFCITLRCIFLYLSYNVNTSSVYLWFLHTLPEPEVIRTQPASSRVNLAAHKFLNSDSLAALTNVTLHLKHTFKTRKKIDQILLPFYIYFENSA